MAALRRMHARDRGVIVQVGSALSYRAIPLQAAYCGAKFAIRGFTDSIRTELLADHSQVRVTMVQLPGVNTTQFNWCRSKLPKHPQPVPPIYQPEIPAEAVYWAAQHKRRELWVGYSTIQAIVGNKLSPWFADRYLARNAIKGQQVQDMPVSADRPDNLYEPRPELAATHGIFDSQAKRRSPQLWANTHRPLIAAAAAALGLALARRWAQHRTSCASTRCWRTASAASSWGRAASSRGCASRAGTRTRCSRASSAAAGRTR
jgi:hypothetical protein